MSRMMNNRPTDTMLRQLIIAMEKQTQAIQEQSDAIMALAQTNAEIIDLITQQKAIPDIPKATSLDQRVDELFPQHQTL